MGISQDVWSCGEATSNGASETQTSRLVVLYTGCRREQLKSFFPALFHSV
jgi:hypothetical protein